MKNKTALAFVALFAALNVQCANAAPAAGAPLYTDNSYPHMPSARAADYDTNGFADYKDAPTEFDKNSAGI